MIQVIRFSVFIVCITLLVWLAISESPTERRRHAVNAAFADGRLGPLEVNLQNRFEEQIAWLGRYAGITDLIEVNKGITRGKLSIVVTTPEVFSVTRCGKGNALYDPSLDTIFVDADLIKGADLEHIGQRGAILMLPLNGVNGIVSSSLSFIIAHEMGHRQSRSPAAAFFAADWLQSGKIATESELSADQFATQTLLRARSGGDTPNFLIADDALRLSGLAAARLDHKESAAAEIMGTMIGMSLTMQFTSSPYSPFFHDAAHPSFLKRAAMAIQSVSSATSERIVADAPLIAEQIRRTESLGQWQHHELHLPAPLARVEVRDGIAWVGTRNFLHANSGPPSERLYRLDFASNVGSLIFMKEGRSGDGELPGTWLDSLIERGDPLLSLNPPAPADIRKVRLFVPTNKWRGDGFAYEGDGWKWSGSGTEDGISVKDLESSARHLFSVDKVMIGRPQRISDQILIPVLTFQRSALGRLRVLAVKSGQASVAQPPFGLDFFPETGIDVDSVLRGEHHWLALGRVDNAIEPFRWRLWKLPDGLTPKIVAEGRFLASFIRGDGETSFGRDLDPDSANLLPLGNELFLIWHNQNSVWLVNADSAKVAFHPAPRELQVTALGNASALFWIENASKVYVVNFSKAIGGK